MDHSFLLHLKFSIIVVFTYKCCPLISPTGTRLLGEEWGPLGKAEAAWSAREENRGITLKRRFLPLESNHLFHSEL
jgi:hypothetical protein